MGFASASKLAAVVAGSGGGGGYLNPSKVQAGTSKRFKILSDAPLDSWCVWGEDPSGACKPFRFPHDPSPAEINEKMGGDYVRRMNREGTAPEAVKPGMSFFVYEYDSSSVMLCEFTQKSLIKELLSIASLEEYENLEEWDFTLGREGSGLATEYSLRAVPAKKGEGPAIAAAWEAAQAKGYSLDALLTGDSPFGS